MIIDGILIEVIVNDGVVVYKINRAHREKHNLWPGKLLKEVWSACLFPAQWRTYPWARVVH